jgi:hypothetical protein
LFPTALFICSQALEVALQWLYCVYALFQLRQEDSDDMDETEGATTALAILEDGREVPEAYQALLLSLVRA